MRFLTTATLALLATAANAQYSNSKVEQHVTAARAVAGEHAGMVDRLCPMPGTARAGTVPAGGPRPVPARDTWHAEPVKVSTTCTSSA